MKNDSLEQKARKQDVIEKISELSDIIAKESGYSEHGGAKKLVQELESAGGIGSETASTIKKGINMRNAIAHPYGKTKYPNVNITKEDVSKLSNATDVVKDVIENGFVTEF